MSRWTSRCSASSRPPATKSSSSRATTYDDSPESETDLIESLRRYSELSGGASFRTCSNRGGLYRRSSFKEWRNPSTQGTKVRRRSGRKRSRARVTKWRSTKGMMFTVDQLPTQADAHYAGRGVSLGAADKPIFWYRPKGASSTASSTPISRSTRPTRPPACPFPPTRTRRGLIEMFRLYSELRPAQHAEPHPSIRCEEIVRRGQSRADLFGLFVQQDQRGPRPGGRLTLGGELQREFARGHGRHRGGELQTLQLVAVGVEHAADLRIARTPKGRPFPGTARCGA